MSEWGRLICAYWNPRKRFPENPGEFTSSQCRVMLITMSGDGKKAYFVTFSS